MRSVVAVSSVVLLSLILLPGAAAQATVTATAPADPIMPGSTLTVPVTFSADCATVLTEYDASGTTELEIELKEGGPAWLTGVGDTIPFSFDMCDPTSATVESTGNLVLTAASTAPGLKPFNVEVGAKGEEGSTTVSILIAYVGSFSFESEGPEFMLDEGNGTASFVLNYTGNADSMGMIEVTGEPEFGTIEGLPPTLDLDSPLTDNLTSRRIPLEFTYHANPGANFSMDMVTLSVMAHAKDDPSLMTEPQTIMFHFMMMDHDMMGHEGHEEGEHDHSTHEHGSNVPGFDLALVVVAALAVAFVARRRA
jgi:hypothetical protein